MLPPVQLRKSAGRGKNPFLFAMLFEKNIEIFSAPNPSVLCVFSICLPPFRAWTSGAGREAGSWQGDAVQPGFTQLLGRQAGTGGGCIGPVSASGGVTLTTKDTAIQYGLVSEVSELAVQYTWKSTQRIAAETHPVNVAFPVCLYLGIPA